ncbi:MAG: hypothetical protein HN494_06435, partial [Opitutae bacterium]|nr:hypothetical protein [Opitutae bacterium]
EEFTGEATGGGSLRLPSGVTEGSSVEPIQQVGPAGFAFLFGLEQNAL